MSDGYPSRAFDPSYQPQKSWADLANENPQSPGLKMLADRERALAKVVYVDFTRRPRSTRY
jgi:hypothetical protein